MLSSFLLKLNRIPFLLSGIGLSALTLIISAFLIPHFESLDSAVSYSTMPAIVEAFIKGVIFAPFFETIIFQSFIYWLTNKLIKTEHTRNLIFLIISSIAFGLSHFYSIYYIIYTTVIGIILACFYIISKKRKESAIKNVIIIHASFNFILFIGGVIIYLIDNNHL